MDTDLRRARGSDVPGIARLVEAYALKGLLLPRPREQVLATLDLWVVATRGSRLVACGSLFPYSSSLTEVRSLAVEPELTGQGLGTAVLRALLREAQRRGVRRVFALTRQVSFFEKSGFRPSPAARFPEKIWRDCALCPRREACDEQAVVLDLLPPALPTPDLTLTEVKGEPHVPNRP